MSDIQTPLDVNLDGLDITSAERELLVSNLVIPAKQYACIAVAEASGTRVFNRINSEVFVLKVIEHNAELINALASERNFFMNRARSIIKNEAMLVLSNGFIARGTVGFNTYENTYGFNTAFIKAKVEGGETVESIDINDVVLINTALTPEQLALIPALDMALYNEVAPATVVDMPRTRGMSSLFRDTKPKPGSKRR